MWFHLSKSKWVNDAITELRQTQKGYGEPKVDRFSVSSSIGRAYLGCPHAKEGVPLFIYQVHVDGPERTFDTTDYELTNEHLITTDILAKHSGSIPVSLVGEVLVENGERTDLLLALRQWNLNMSHEEEKTILWDVTGTKWRFKLRSQDEATKLLTQLRSVERG